VLFDVGGVDHVLPVYAVAPIATPVAAPPTTPPATAPVPDVAGRDDEANAPAMVEASSRQVARKGCRDTVTVTLPGVRAT